MNTIPEIIQDIAQGKMVILMDDEDRENEGDLIMAASLVRPEDINFMAQYGRGLICLTLTEARCEQLKLAPMAPDNHSKFGTNFTVSIEAASGVTTGISAADRAVTVQAAVKPEARPEDLNQPGHIFPLKAQSGGVLYRAGHTEAGCDLARLAGLEPAAVIVEILNEDGSMARRPDLEKFAEQHQLKMGTIADLIEYRLQTEKTIERIAESSVQTQHGRFDVFAYQDPFQHKTHLALTCGHLTADYPTLVRVHVQDYLADTLGVSGLQTSYSLNAALAKVAKAGHGVVVILSEYDGVERFVASLQNTVSNAQTEHHDLRMIGIGSQILSDLGLKKLRVMSSPKKIHALSGFDLEITDYVEV